ncbi:MAG: hypothetical protein IKJ41_10840 [Clostridia bacterium]|nr:hypothetical protein [Clostridia bacterium]
MVNIWNYKDCDTIEITDTDGNVFKGRIVDITDAEEKSDLEEYEDSITIKVDENNIEFLQNEIAEIKIIR